MPIINSKIDKTVKIWHEDLVNIYDSEIGNNTKIGSFVEIGRCKIGTMCVISSFCFLCEGVTVEDGVFFGPRVTMTNILFPRALIEQKDNFVPTLIEAGVTLGAGAVIVAGVKIGKSALIGAGAVVTRDILSYALVSGNPATMQCWICKNGCKMRERHAECPKCGVTND